MQTGSGVMFPDEVSIPPKSTESRVIPNGNPYSNGRFEEKNNEYNSIYPDSYHQPKNNEVRRCQENTHSSSKHPPLDSKMVQSPITNCIVQGNHRLLLECLVQGESPHTVCSNSGQTFLHLIAQHATTDRELNWVPMVFQLSNAGIGLDPVDHQGTTACTITISKKLVQVLASLLKCGAELRESDWTLAEQTRGVTKPEMLETMRRLSPSYWTAVHDMTPFKVNRLVKAWARVNVSRKGQSLVEYAKKEAREEMIVKLLLAHEASIELAHAVMAGDRDRVRTLLCDSAVDLATTDTSVKNNSLEPIAPLTLNGAAIKLGHVDVLHDLVAAKERRRKSAVYNNNIDSRFGSRDDSYYGGKGWGSQTTMNYDPTVVFYKGRNNEDVVCQIRTPSKPVTSKLCVIS